LSTEVTDKEAKPLRYCTCLRRLSHFWLNTQLTATFGGWIFHNCYHLKVKCRTSAA